MASFLRRGSRTILERLTMEPNEAELEAYFGPWWRFAIAGTRLEAAVLANELLGDL